MFSWDTVRALVLFVVSILFLVQLSLADGFCLSVAMVC
jgi:hypothetical protein